MLMNRNGKVARSIEQVRNFIVKALKPHRDGQLRWFDS
jgi:hypothetical protein